MPLVTSYDKAKIDDLLADLQAWATANLAPVTEPLAVAAQADVDALTTTVASNDSAAVHKTGAESIAGVKTFTDRIQGNSSDNYFGDGVDGSGPSVDIGNLGTASCWVDARGSDANVPLILRAKGSSDILTNSRLNAAQALRENVAIVNAASYSATLQDRHIVVNVASTITLPNNAGGLWDGKRYTIINNGTGAVTISAPSAGLTGFTTTLPPRHVVNLWSDGFGYYGEDNNGTIVCTSTSRPTGNLYAGMVIYETDTTRTRIYDGSGWKTHTDISSGTWTPTLTNVSGGTASGKYRYINQYLMEIQIAITAGTLTTAGTVVSASLPPAIVTDSFMTQPIACNFNTNISPTAFAQGGDTKVQMSYINPQTAANIAAGTSLANVRFAGVLAIA